MAEMADGGVRSVQLALDVLETVAFSKDALGVTEIAGRIGVAKGSVYRHLSTLVDRGYLSQNRATARYSIGPKRRLLARMASDDDLVEIAREAMRDLRDRLGQTIVLSSFTTRGPLVTFALASVSPIEIGVRPGSELPFQSTAQGRVMLAYSPRPFQERVLSQDIVRLTVNTITDRLVLEAEIGRIAKQGYAIAAEEAMLGVSAIAGPVFDQDDHIVATVAAVGSIQFLPAVPEKGTISDVRNCCDQISRRMGHGQRSSNVATLPRAAVKRRVGRSRPFITPLPETINGKS